MDVNEITQLTQTEVEHLFQMFKSGLSGTSNKSLNNNDRPNTSPGHTIVDEDLNTSAVNGLIIALLEAFQELLEYATCPVYTKGNYSQSLDEEKTRQKRTDFQSRLALAPQSGLKLFSTKYSVYSQDTDLSTEALDILRKHIITLLGQSFNYQEKGKLSHIKRAAWVVGWNGFAETLFAPFLRITDKADIAQDFDLIHHLKLNLKS